MFCKKNTEGYLQMAEGVEMKTLVHGEKTLMSEFRIAKGAVVPTHAHPHEQTGFMVSGTLRFDVDGEIFEAQTGDSWNIAGGRPHSATALEDAVAVEIFSPVREEYLP
jgi:quercetin dioxygenase-like cupin family protein